MKRIIEWFKNCLNCKKIRTQLLTVYLFAGIFPILLIGGYLLFNNSRLILKQHTDLASAYNVRSKSVMLDITTAVTNISEEIFSDKVLQQILSTEFQNTQEMHDMCRLYNKLDSYAQNYTEISNLWVYTDNPMINYGRLKPATADDKNSSWYRLAVESFTPHWLTWSYKNKYGNRIVQLRLVRKIPVIRTGKTAILVIDVNNNHLKSLIGTDPLDTILSVNSDPVFFATVPDCIGENFGILSDTEKELSKFIALGGSKKLAEISSLTPVYSSDSIQIVTIDNAAVSNMKSMFWNCSLIVLFSLLVPLIMILCFTQTFSSRVGTLKREMHKVGQGHYDIIQNFYGNDELADLFSELKTMIEKIKTRDKEIYQDRIMKQQLVNHQQKMEFKMLSNQINPHFLYNTLETIRMKAFIAGDLEVATAIKLLGKSMRHFLESGDAPVSLESELKYVKIYLEIQKIRFKDKFNYSLYIDPKVNCGEFKILPLLLQPVVENAMVHGLEEKESGGMIRIEVKAASQKLLIVISDNGCGMTEKQQEKIVKQLRGKIEITGDKIGLCNVQKRIQMFYGNSYGIELSSRPGKGTKTTITLPMFGKETVDDSIDRR